MNVNASLFSEFNVFRYNLTNDYQRPDATSLKKSQIALPLWLLQF